MSDDMISRMLRRAEELDLSPRGLSLKAGLGPTTVRDIVNRPGASPRLTTMRKLAAALGTTPEWLSYGQEDAANGALQSRDAAAPRVVLPLYGGIVETDAYRPPTPERASALVDLELADADFPDVTLLVFDVAGGGMGALRPLPILPGMRVIALASGALGDRLPLRDGMIVVVERPLGERLRELSLRQVQARPGGLAFLARSTDANYEPIETDFTTKSKDGTITIIAIVRRIFFAP